MYRACFLALLVACAAGIAASEADVPRKVMRSEEVDKKHKPKPPATCGDNKGKRDCLHLGSDEGDCAWCAGGYMPETCLSTMAAKYLPEMVATCKLPKHKKEEVVQAADAGQGSDANKHKPKTPASCGDNKDKRDCLDLGAEEGDCAWCEGEYMKGSCWTTTKAKFIPEMVAKCKLPKHKDEQLQAADDANKGGKKPKPEPAAVSCGDNDNKGDCLDLGAQEGECAWCKGDFMPPSCVSTSAAKWIPETVASCKLPQKHTKELQAAEAAAGTDGKKPEPKPAAVSCGDNDNKGDCLDLGAQEGECAWCKGDFMPPSCVSTSAAKWIPETVASCKLPKKHTDDEEEEEDLLEKKHHKKGGGSGGDYPSGGGDWPSGGGDWPSGGGDYPGPSGGGSSGGQGQGGCQDIKSRKKCLRGAGGSQCAWCAKSFMGSGCQDAMSVKYLPSFIADCKIGKEPKKGVAAS